MKVKYLVAALEIDRRSGEAYISEMQQLRRMGAEYLHSPRGCMLYRRLRLAGSQNNCEKMRLNM